MGFYEVAVSEAFQQSLRGRQSFAKIGWLGMFPDEVDEAALYLKDEKQVLSICGNTQIRGTAFLPKAGVQTAYINQKSYKGKQLIYGEQKQSQRVLPSVDKNWLQYHFDILHKTKDLLGQM